MFRGFLARLKGFRSRCYFRPLWLFLSLLMLGVQTVLPAHQKPARLRRYSTPDSLIPAAAFVLGVAAYAAGLVLSTIFDLPSSALIVWCLAACAVIMARMRSVIGGGKREART